MDKRETYSRSSICGHVRIMYNAKERDVREGAEDKKKYQIKRTRPNTPKFDAIIADKESILLRQDKVQHHLLSINTCDMFNKSQYNHYVHSVIKYS